MSCATSLIRVKSYEGDDQVIRNAYVGVYDNRYLINLRHNYDDDSRIATFKSFEQTSENLVEYQFIRFDAHCNIQHLDPNLDYSLNIGNSYLIDGVWRAKWYGIEIETGADKKIPDWVQLEKLEMEVAAYILRRYTGSFKFFQCENPFLATVE